VAVIVCLSVCLFVYPSNFLILIGLSVCQIGTVCLSVWQSVCRCMSVNFCVDCNHLSVACGACVCVCVCGCVLVWGYESGGCGGVGGVWVCAGVGGVRVGM
jgi:hypothetical protein